MTLALDVGLRTLPVASAKQSTVTVPVTLFGTFRCARTLRVRLELSRAGIDYKYVDLDVHGRIRQQLRALIHDGIETPIVRLEREWLMAPIASELQAALKRHNLVALPD